MSSPTLPCLKVSNLKNEINTYNTGEFFDRYMAPDPGLEKIIRQDSIRFFIVRVQDMIRLSKLPVPPTRVETHTLVYLTSGVATMKIGFENVEIRTNECMVVPAGKVFSYQKYEVNEGYICSLSPDFLLGKIGNNELLAELEFLNIWENPVIKPASKNAPYLRSLFQRILEEYTDNGLTKNQIIPSYLIAALCELNLAYRATSGKKGKTALALTNRFRELLQKHLSTRRLVADYAEMMNVSPNHLNKTIKSVTAKSPSTLIGETLVNEAKVMLLQTNAPVNEIASSLGLEDQSYFSRLFKKYEGITPLEFRKVIDMS